MCATFLVTYLRLIVDTNRIIAALLRDSYSRKILSSGRFEFLVPKLVYHEITANKQDLLSKSELSEERFNAALSSLMSRTTVVDEQDYFLKLPEAMQIMGKIDPKDATFIALALSIPNNGIWTEDRHFEKQDVVRVWKTAELLGLI